MNADSVVVETDSLSGTVRRLVGNVAFRQDTTALRAARAVQYVERGEVFLEGGVRIVSGGDTLTADRVTYTAASKIARAEGRVRIADGVSVLLAPSAAYASRERLAAFDAGGTLLHDGATLTAPRGTYDTRTRFATAEGGTRLVDSTTVVTAEGGTYDARARRADLFGGVRLNRRAVRMEADSLTHFRRTEVSHARGRVVLERLGDESDDPDGGAAPDSSRRTLLFGTDVEHDDRAGRSRVAGGAGLDPLLVQLRTDSTGAVDTTLVRARYLVVVRPPEEEGDAGPRTTRLTAWGGALVQQPRFAATADSAVFLRTDSTEAAPARDRLALHGTTRPSVWFDEAQLTGDTLTASAAGERLDSLLVVGSAFAAQLDTTLGRVRQIRGRRMLALFEGGEENRLRRLSVWPNAEAIYFRATADGRLDGADRLSADSLAFLFGDRELREVRGARGIEGTAYGPEIVPEGLALDGYVYTPERRPTRDALLPPDGWEAVWLVADAAPGAPEALPEPDVLAPPESATPTPPDPQARGQAP